MIFVSPKPSSGLSNYLFPFFLKQIITMDKPLGTSTDHIESASTGKQLPREVEDINSIPLGWFVWMVATTASIAGLLFGYILPFGFQAKSLIQIQI